MQIVLEESCSTTCVGSKKWQKMRLATASLRSCLASSFCIAEISSTETLNLRISWLIWKEISKSQILGWARKACVRTSSPIPTVAAQNIWHLRCFRSNFFMTQSGAFLLSWLLLFRRLALWTGHGKPSFLFQISRKNILCHPKWRNWVSYLCWSFSWN